MYEPGPTDAELAVAGLTREEVTTSVEIWPENLRACMLFQSLQTQWNLAPMGGPVGLNFVVAYARMDRMELTPEEYNQLDEDLQLLEAAALATMRESH
jgi:hypothetical protein